MIRNDRPGYWRATRRLALLVLLVWLALGAGASLVASELGALVLFGIPVSYLLPVVISPVGLIGLAFWFADRQDRIDRTYGMAEED